MIENIKTDYHQPVMVGEVLELIKPKRGGVFVDCTLGGGGHVRAMLEQLKTNNEKLKVIGIDRDEEAIEEARTRLIEYDNVILVKDNFVNIDKILKDQNIKKVDRILVDLGVSSHQLDDASRGFSFKESGGQPLDMRMDRSQEKSAYDVVNFYSKENLARIIKEFGEERYYRKITDAIVEARRRAKIKTTGELVRVVELAVPRRAQFGRKHFATNVFRAIRIEVNEELDVISSALPKMLGFLAPGGVLVMISFHSLEDRIVKNIFKSYAGEFPQAYKILTKKPLVASTKEISENRRARSAKLRAIAKIV
jgi:16S rRNA (cytosine1402-N4)-methyltransferase